MRNDMVWIIVALVWIIGGLISYEYVFKKWDEDDASKFEKAWYAVVWPMVLLLYLVHVLHNNL